jgi:hypothetical protein
MPDPNTPVELVIPTTPQQVEDFKPRYTGAVQKIEQMTLAQRETEAQLAAKNSELEQLRAQLGIKDVEKTVAISERDKHLQEALTTNASQAQENAELRSLKLKIEVIKELGRPDLLQIADSLPNMTDKEALKTVLSTFTSYADNAAAAREKQLTSGLTPGFTSTQVQQSALPATEEAWNQHINGLQLGSKERAKAMDDKWAWLVKTHSS